MVTELKPNSGRSVRLVLAPNQSLSWTGNLYISVSLLLVSLFIGLIFMLWGAWVIFPFALLEVFLLIGVFYFINKNLRCQEVVSIDDGSILIEKGAATPEQRWEFPRRNAVVVIQEEGTDSFHKKVLISGERGLIQVGEFLNSSDCVEMLKSLKSSGLSMRTQGPLVVYSF